MSQFQIPGGPVFDGDGASGQFQAPGGASFDAEAPAAPQLISVPAASLILTALVPIVLVTANVQIDVPPGAMTLTPLAPAVSVGQDRLIQVPLATLHLTALVPRLNAIDETVTAIAPACRSGLLLTEPLNLRKSSQLGTFSEEAWLPQRYGDLRKTRFKLIRLSPTRWLAAGHSMPSITSVYVDGLKTTAFAFRTKAVGEIIYTEVELGAAAPLNAEVTASGIGKLHGTTGALIENPADIAADIMLLAGRVDPWWGQLRSECSALSLTLAGSITEPGKVQEHIDTVVDSAGGMWCAGMAQLYPLPIGGDTFVLPLTKFQVHDLAVTTSLIDTADTLKLSYAYDEAEGQAKSFVELAANPRRFCGMAAEVTLPMLRGAAAAEAVGRRLLGRKAGERFDVAFATDATEFIRPGTWVLVQDHPRWPFAGNPYVKIISSTIDRSAGFASVRGETVLSTPRIDVIAHSIGLQNTGVGGIEITFGDGVATITIFDQDGAPFPKAYVSLDGGVPKVTDASGQVKFITVAGSHKVAVAKEGYGPAEQGFTL